MTSDKTIHRIAIIETGVIGASWPHSSSPRDFRSLRRTLRPTRRSR
ncbi:hypothetical protein [Bradyrhizobium embrapense]|nr:hypothetical protein [Bradyrhizobium embrapense]